MAPRCCLVLIAALALAITAPAAGAAPTSSHVVLIVLENHEFDEVIGAPEAPFLNGLATRGALATNYHAIGHPSLPNYLALLGGSTYGVGENCGGCMTPGPNLATQLSAAGIAWRAYMGAMPRACFAGAEAGQYVKRHNPFMHSRAVASDPALCRRVVPETGLDADLRRHRLPAFAWLSPNLCADGHDCLLTNADRHLAALIPRITPQLGPHGLLVVTFDEGTSDADCCGGTAGGRVATILAGPDVPPGTLLRRPFDHYSLLAALEDRFGLARLRHARGADPLPLAG
ncbi:MAG: alkaline phosphatase family protein [Solirubrobacterales bacterium]